MSFAEMQSINAGVPVAWLLREFPFARDIRRRPDGSIAELGYLVVDPLEDTRPVLFLIDPQGRVAQKRYGGPIVRPPPVGGVPVEDASPAAGSGAADGQG
jgi:hypothetical protein